MDKMPHRALLATLVVALLFLSAACSVERTGLAAQDGGTGDVNVPIPGDASVDANRPDAGRRDAGVDAGPVGVDAGMDAGRLDAGMDAGRDAGMDAGRDAGIDAGRDAGIDAGVDAGVDAGMDAGVDAGMDAGVDAGMDAGVDAGPVDAGCSPSGVSCVGDVLTDCSSGVLTETDCTTMSSYCGLDSTGVPRCIPWVCTPGMTWCSSDGMSSLTCDARGDAETSTACAYGCDASTGACNTAPPMCTLSYTDVALGSSTRFDLCSESNDFTEVIGGACSASGGGRDRLFRLVLTAATDVNIDVRDDDGTVAIDTLLYIRSTCDDMSSQVACDDDVPCATSYYTSGCYSGYQWRESRIQTTLPAGTYYIITDIVRHSGWGCGYVLLTVDGTPA